MAAIVKVFVLFAATLCVNGQITKFGRCPNITNNADFKLQDYLGIWYETQSYWSLLDIPLRCPAIEYMQLSNGNLGVTKIYTDLFNIRRTIDGEARIDSQVPSRFHLTIPRGNPFSMFQWDVLYTDYTDYAIVWSCRPGLFLAHSEFAWIMTRQRIATLEIIQSARKKMDELGLDTERLSNVDQSRCKDVQSTQSNSTVTTTTSPTTDTTTSRTTTTADDATTLSNSDI